MPLHFPPAPFTGEREIALQFLKDFNRCRRLNQQHPYMIDPVLRIHTMLGMMDGPAVTPWKTKCAELIRRPAAASFGEELWTEYTRKFAKVWGSKSPASPPVTPIPKPPATHCSTPQTPPPLPDTTTAARTRSEDTAERLLLTSELDVPPSDLDTSWPPLIPSDSPAPAAVPASSNADYDWSDIIRRWEKNLPQYVLGPMYQSTPLPPRFPYNETHSRIPDDILTSSPCSSVPVECSRRHPSDGTSPRTPQYRPNRRPVTASDRPLEPRSSPSPLRPPPTSSPRAALPAVPGPVRPSHLVPWSFASPRSTLLIDEDRSSSTSIYLRTLSPRSATPSPLSSHSLLLSRSDSPSLAPTYRPPQLRCPASTAALVVMEDNGPRRGVKTSPVSVSTPRTTSSTRPIRQYPSVFPQHALEQPRDPDEITTHTLYRRPRDRFPTSRNHLAPRESNTDTTGPVTSRSSAIDRRITQDSIDTLGPHRRPRHTSREPATSSNTAPQPTQRQDSPQPPDTSDIHCDTTQMPRDMDDNIATPWLHRKIRVSNKGTRNQDVSEALRKCRHQPSHPHSSMTPTSPEAQPQNNRQQTTANQETCHDMQLKTRTTQQRQATQSYRTQTTPPHECCTADLVSDFPNA
ncbi:hypothetical protein EDB92DRAFT_1939739 [Lactarius akahatsu]|uniref:Uncharacterized protein n=1 Tax=Lactarius akahatsu TaxID=416441 RepID=A0AAD4LRN2_9AGAM|nr:hypothetical protein EDB92DRAFT_1939739 [Lactarius akahatsu]